MKESKQHSARRVPVKNPFRYPPVWVRRLRYRFMLRKCLHGDSCGVCKYLAESFADGPLKVWYKYQKLKFRFLERKAVNA